MNDMEKSKLMDEIAHRLDISPKMYDVSKSVVSGIENYLENSTVFLQGSFKLGTIIRPFIGDEDGDFDIDLVVKSSQNKNDVYPNTVKKNLGEILKKSPYGRYLVLEGKRCWTLNYENRDVGSGSNGFHIDLLPCVAESNEEIQLIEPKEYRDKSIAITELTDSRTRTYDWRKSNPEGYADWFDGVNLSKYVTARDNDKKRVFDSNDKMFKSVETVAIEYTRTPLQKVIQILKRHRDIMYARDPDNKPISIIITTCVAKIVEDDTKTYDTYELLNHVLTELELNGEKYRVDGKWSIPNPTNSKENLADKWNKDKKKAEEFFNWLKQAKKDLIDILNDTPESIKKNLKKSLGITDAQADSIFSVAIVAPKPMNVTGRSPKPYGDK